MSSSSLGSLEGEDLDNVALVRMEDVQPSRERAIDALGSPEGEGEAYETCIIEDIEYINECVVNDDDDSNIGSMVSLQSSEAYEGDSSSQEVIIPEVLDVDSDNDESDIYVANKHEEIFTEEYLGEEENELEAAAEGYLEMPEDNDVKEPSNMLSARDKINSKEYVLAETSGSSPQAHIEVEVPPSKIRNVEQVVINPPSESWPTLEILPGGVIKNTDKYEADSYLYPDKDQEKSANVGEMMYACAKCSQTFKYLFCLVKHVKWHEDQKKSMIDPKTSKLTPMEKEMIAIENKRIEMEKKYKKRKLEIFSRVAGALGKISSSSNVKKMFNK